MEELDLRPFSFYEQVGIFFPGAALLLGIGVIFPNERLVIEGGISIGNLGLFLIASYVVGHIVAFFGNLIEWAVWSRKGMPSTWVLSEKRIVSTNTLSAIASTYLGRAGEQIVWGDISREEWKEHFARIYRDVLTNSDSTRIESFVGMYGLTRGLSASSALLIAYCAIKGESEYPVYIFLVLSFFVFIIRMIRYSKYVAKEVLYQFIAMGISSDSED